MAGKPVEKLVGGPFLYSGVNSVLLTSFMELQVIQLLERREACSAGQRWGSLCFKQGVLYQLAVSRLNQRGLLVCAGILCVEAEQPWVQQECCGCVPSRSSAPTALLMAWWKRAGWVGSHMRRGGHGPAASAGSSLNPLPLGGGEPSGKDHAHDRNYFDCNFWRQRIQICLASFPSAMSLPSSAA